MLPTRFDSYAKLVAAVRRLVQRGGVRTITFDVFDTLIHRRLAPELVVEGVCHRLHDLLAEHGIDVSPRSLRELRHRAYMELVAEHVAAGLDGDTTLDELAAHWITHAAGAYTTCLDATKVARKLVAIEVDLEQRVCFANPWLQALLPELKAAQVHVACVSDMYLGAQYVRAILERCGLLSWIDEVYVSGDCRLLKRTGRLFEHVQQQIGTPVQDWLHIGDNFHADGLMARRCGTRAWIVNDPLLHRQARRHDFDAKTYFTRPTWGGVLIAAYAQPLPGEAFSDEEAFAYRILGPIFASFIHRVLERCRETGVGHVYFLAREGHLLQRLYRHLSPLVYPDGSPPPSSYLAVSRLTALAATMSHYGIRALAAAIANTGHYAIRTLLAPLGLPPARLVTVALRNDCPNIDAPLPAPACEFPPLLRILEDPEIAQAVHQRGEQARSLLHAYLAQNGFFQHRRVALVDVGWGGQIQDSLFAGIRSTTTAPMLLGFYLGTNRLAAWRRCSMSRMEGLLADFSAPEWSAAAAFEFVFALEAAARAPHGTTLGYRSGDAGAVEPIFRDNDDAARQAELADDCFIAGLQSGIVRYVDRYAECAAMLHMSASETLPYARTMIERLVRYPSSEETAWWRGLNNAADLGSSEAAPLGSEATLPGKLQTLLRMRELAATSVFHYGIAGQLAGTPGQVALALWKGLHRWRDHQAAASLPLAPVPLESRCSTGVAVPIAGWVAAVDEEVKKQQQAVGDRRVTCWPARQSTISLRELFALVVGYRLARLLARVARIFSTNLALPSHDAPSLSTMLQRELHARYNLRARLTLIRNTYRRLRQ